MLSVGCKSETDIATNTTRLVGWSIEDNATDISADQRVVGTFSRSMDKASTESAISATPSVTLVFSWSEDQTQVTIAPTPAWGYQTQYSLALASSAKNLDGDQIDEAGSLRFTTQSDPYAHATYVAAGPQRTCAIYSTGVACWGVDMTSAKPSPPTLSNPTQVGVAYAGACAIDDTGLVCWGYYSPTEITSPTDLSMGGGWENNLCALGSSGVVCKGQATEVPTLVNPTQVSVGAGHACALDDTGVVCWGDNQQGQATPPTLSNPTQVSAGGWHTCALDSAGVVCWGLNTYGQATPPTLSNPTQISAGGFSTCAIDDSGVVCWGTLSSQVPMPTSFTKVTQISHGTEHVCAIDDNQVVCWGANSWGESTPL